MRKIILLILVAMVMGGCARKETAYIKENLEACVGKHTSCTKSINLPSKWDYNRSMYMWKFEGVEDREDGGIDMYYLVKSQMNNKGKFSRKYAKVTSHEGIITSYEWVYNWKPQYMREE